MNALQLAPTFATTGEVIVTLSSTGVMLGTLDLKRKRMTGIKYTDTLAESTAPPFSVGGKPWGAVYDGWQRSFGQTLAFSPDYAFSGMIVGVGTNVVVASYDRGRTWKNLHTLETTDSQCALRNCLRCHNPAGERFAHVCAQCAPGFVVQGSGSCTKEPAPATPCTLPCPPCRHIRRGFRAYTPVVYSAGSPAALATAAPATATASRMCAARDVVLRYPSLVSSEGADLDRPRTVLGNTADPHDFAPQVLESRTSGYNVVFAMPAEGCSQLTNDPTTITRSTLVFVQRGTCPFADKAWHVQQFGAGAAIIYNTEDQLPVTGIQCGGAHCAAITVNMFYVAADIAARVRAWRTRFPSSDTFGLGCERHFNAARDPGGFNCDMRNKQGLPSKSICKSLSPPDGSCEWHRPTVKPPNGACVYMPNADAVVLVQDTYPHRSSKSTSAFRHALAMAIVGGALCSMVSGGCAIAVVARRRRTRLKWTAQCDTNSSHEKSASVHNSSNYVIQAIDLMEWRRYLKINRDGNNENEIEWDGAYGNLGPGHNTRPHPGDGDGPLSNECVANTFCKIANGGMPSVRGGWGRRASRVRKSIRNNTHMFGPPDQADHLAQTNDLSQSMLTPPVVYHVPASYGVGEPCVLHNHWPRSSTTSGALV